jgi:hypothetical protein
MSGKQKCELHHARTRLLERYRITMSTKEWNMFMNSNYGKENYEKGGYSQILKATNTRSLRKYKLNDLEIYYIWNVLNRQPSTFLTKEMVDNSLKQIEQTGNYIHNNQDDGQRFDFDEGQWETT